MGKLAWAYKAISYHLKYIEIYCNQRRKHSTNGWKTHAHCEQEWYNLKNST